MNSGWSPSSRTCSEAPSQTKNNGPKNPSVMPNSCRASRRGSPIADTTSPSAKPASMIETWVASATADSPNRKIRLNRSSSANLCFSK